MGSKHKHHILTWNDAYKFTTTRIKLYNYSWWKQCCVTNIGWSGSWWSFRSLHADDARLTHHHRRPLY